GWFAISPRRSPRSPTGAGIPTPMATPPRRCAAATSRPGADASPPSGARSDGCRARTQPEDSAAPSRSDRSAAVPRTRRGSGTATVARASPTTTSPHPSTARRSGAARFSWFLGQPLVQRRNQGTGGVLVALDHPVRLPPDADGDLGGEPLMLGLTLFAAEVGANGFTDDAGEVFFAGLGHLAQGGEFPFAQAQGDTGTGAFLERSVRRVRHGFFPRINPNRGGRSRSLSDAASDGLSYCRTRESRFQERRILGVCQPSKDASGVPLPCLPKSPREGPNGEINRRPKDHARPAASTLGHPPPRTREPAPRGTITTQASHDRERMGLR